MSLTGTVPKLLGHAERCWLRAKPQRCFAKCPRNTRIQPLQPLSAHLSTHSPFQPLRCLPSYHIRSGSRTISCAAAPAAPTEASPGVEPVLLEVSGMKCGGCSAAVKRILLSQPEIVSAASVNLLTESAAVTFSPSAVAGSPPDQLAKQAAEALSEKGFPSKPRSSEADTAGDAEAASSRKEAELRRSLLDLGLAWGLVLLCCTHHFGHLAHVLGWHSIAHTPIFTFSMQPMVQAALGSFALLGPGRPLIVDGALALARGAPTMNSLVGLGAVTSFAAGTASWLMPDGVFDVSFLEEPVMLLAFVLLGRALESRARLQASADLRSLAQLIPSQARLVMASGAKDAASEAVQVQTASVRRGDVLQVLPGEKFPVDGEVLQGSCSVDESMLTGESQLVAKQPGSQVAGGTVCFSASVTVRATSTGAQSQLAGVGRLVADAQSREVPLQRIADTVAGKFCYTVMASSATTFAFWALAGAALFPGVVAAASAPSAGVLALKLAVDVLVVACPCALGLAAPTAVLMASSLGAQRGLLLRGGDVLERLAGITDVVLDKTGTLTAGRLRMVDVQPFSTWHSGPVTSIALAGNTLVTGSADNGASEQNLLRAAAAVEAGTRHPVADAVRDACGERHISVPEAEQAQTQPGEGASCSLDGQQVAVGRLSFVRHHLDLPPEASDPHEETSTSGRTQVYVASSSQGLLGRLEFEDALREDARAVVRSLQRQGVKVHVMSGDDPTVVERYASLAGIPLQQCAGALTPEGKARNVAELQAQGAKVAMVGDGVNDAPALAAADVGVAMGGGVDAAGQAAGLVLLGDRLGQVVDALELSRAALGKIRQNLAWALVYNLAAIPLAAGALLPSMGLAISPSVAGGMMAVSSLAVVSNSLLLNVQYRKPKAPAVDSAGSGVQGQNTPPSHA